MTRASEGEPALALHSHLPVAFNASGEAVPGDRLYNLRILQSYDLLEDHVGVDRGDPDHPLSGELRRLDSKLSLLLQLFSELLRDRHQPPGASSVRLDRLGIDWANGTAVSPGSRGVLEIFVHPAIPLPLRWWATAGEPQAEGWQRFEFDPLSESESDQLERLIFLAHRQQVADTRRSRRD